MDPKCFSTRNMIYPVVYKSLVVDVPKSIYIALIVIWRKTIANSCVIQINVCEELYLKSMFYSVSPTEIAIEALINYRFMEDTRNRYLEEIFEHEISRTK